MPLPPTGWHKSSHSTDFEEACVEASVAAAGAGILVRDTKDHDRRPFPVSARAWNSFLSALQHDSI
ncbi:DUF397 domain-containing protein [Streptomyces sp. CA-251251]|uniref:DUF397 domain-containing protein n=1 Tax=Streptomyces sp. CA-251251 TaxID=3240063 RepID=UPI003D9101E7